MKKILTVATIVVLCLLLIAFIVIRAQNDVVAPVNTPKPAFDADAEYFTFNFVGDNTLEGSAFESLSGGNPDYPYANTKQYFENAEFNFANLECNFSDDASLYSDSMFHFRAPTKNVEVLTRAGIDFVTTANNHMMDYGNNGLYDTLDTLDAAGIAYGQDGKATVFETENGLRIGIYCGFQQVSEKHVAACINELKGKNVDYIICAFHWGEEGAYRPGGNQKSLAHAAIDAGADLVYGSHPHVLQPVEEYKGCLIMYSLGNWCFGGNSHPADMDTAIIQVTVKRSTDGSVSTADYKLIPCRFSSVSSRNDYCPTPYEEGTQEYERAMSKLLGTFTGPNLVIDYSGMQTPEDTQSPDISQVPQTAEVTDTPPVTRAPLITYNPEIIPRPEKTQVISPTPTPDAEIPETPVPKEIA